MGSPGWKCFLTVTGETERMVHRLNRFLSAVILHRSSRGLPSSTDSAAITLGATRPARSAFEPTDCGAEFAPGHPSAGNKYSPPRHAVNKPSFVKWLVWRKAS